MIYTIFTIETSNCLGLGKKYRIINDIIDERESVRMVNAVPFIHQPDHMALKVSDVSAAYWQHLTHNKTL